MFLLNLEIRSFLMSLVAFSLLPACTQGVHQSNAASQGDGGTFSVSPQKLDPKAVELLESRIGIKIPEESFAVVNPEQLRMIDEISLNKSVMPVISGLRFFSHDRQRDVQIPYEKIENNCFARRTAVDAYLWFGEPLRAKQESRVEPDPGNPFVRNATITKYRYLLRGFEQADYKKRAWVETARVKVLGQLKTNSVSWKEHEAVVVNTQNGVRVIDPSFSKTKALTLDEWFKFFAPQGLCTALKNAEEAAQITQALIMSTDFKMEWPADVPRCGYSFHQRLDARDTLTNTGWSFGNNLEEIFISSKFRSYFEEALLK